MKECGKCGELIEEFYDDSSVCKKCYFEIKDEENLDRIEYADRKRCSGRDGSEDEGW